MKGQAVVIDAIFFMLVCGMAATALFWAGSVYGNKTYEAYKYMYLNDYETSMIAVLGEMSYKDGDTVRYWMTELGEYMKGTFNESSNRYTLLQENFQKLCVQAPAPVLLIVSSPTPGAKRGYCPFAGGKCEKLYFACGRLLDNTWDLSLNETIQNSDGTTTYVVNETKYPYYSSPVTSKMCSTLRCEMVTKIYY